VPVDFSGQEPRILVILLSDRTSGVQLMVNRGVRVIGILGWLAVSATVPAEPVSPLQPVAQWVVDYADTQCIATRIYRSSNDQVTLGIRPSPDGGTYELLVARSGWPPDFAEEMQGGIDFGNGAITAWVLRYGKKKATVDQFRISNANMAQARNAASVTLHVKGESDVTFSLAAMPQLLTGLEKCTANLLEYWNADGEKAGKITESAKGELRALFSSEDFPNEAMTRGQEGSSRFLLLIDEQGKVAGCHVIRTSGIPVFDAMGCQVLQQRAKFKPARDAKAKPVRSMIVTPPITWRIG
jgi:TonB family protein